MPSNRSLTFRTPRLITAHAHEHQPLTNLVTHLALPHNTDISDKNYWKVMTDHLLASSDDEGWLRTPEISDPNTRPLNQYQVSLLDLESCRQSLAGRTDEYQKSLEGPRYSFAQHKVRYLLKPSHSSSSLPPSTEVLGAFQTLFESCKPRLLPFDTETLSEIDALFETSKATSNASKHSETMHAVYGKVLDCIWDADDSCGRGLETLSKAAHSEVKRLGITEDWRAISIPPVKDDLSPPTWLKDFATD